LDEFERFISKWEMETNSIKEKSLAPEECDHISSLFHKDSDGLLVRRPVGVSDEEIINRLDRLDGKLDSVLAMACTSSELTTLKKL
jgi:hypothetical protein